MYLDQIRAELQEAADVLDKFMHDEKNIQLIQEAALLISNSFKQGGKVLSCGNGGSHCDAMHFAEELLHGSFAKTYKGHGTDRALVAGILGMEPSDERLRNSMDIAKEKGMKVIAMTGKDGGQMAGLADVEIRVPHFRYADRTQEIHIKVIHILMMLIEFEMAKAA